MNVIQNSSNSKLTTIAIEMRWDESWSCVEFEMASRNDCIDAWNHVYIKRIKKKEKIQQHAFISIESRASNKIVIIGGTKQHQHHQQK